MRRQLWGLPVGVVFAVLLWTAPTASAADFTVDDTSDAALASPASTSCASTDANKCTLRAAIQAADNAGGAETIALPAGTFTLSIASAGGSNDPAHGDIDVYTPGVAAAPAITLTGTGAGTTIIDGAMVSRVFAVASGASLSIADVAITRGNEPDQSTGNGGAIFSSGSLTITDSELYGNVAGHIGGAVYFAGPALAISGSTFVANQAEDAGGAVAYSSTGGSSTLTNDTFDHNDGGGTGGALAYFDLTSTGKIQNVTIARNSASSASAIAFPGYAGTVENTIIAGNTGGTSCNDGNNTADGGGNVSTDSSCFPPSAAGDKLNVADVKLGLLQDNGGPSETDALEVGSPAIWNGRTMLCPDRDQRGIQRIPDHCDSGAYQGREDDIGLTATGPSSAATGADATDTFTVISDGPYAADVAFTDPLPSGATFTGISVTRGSCTAGATVTCAITGLGPGDTATITVAFTATQPGQLDNEATVSTALDPGSHSDTAGVTTTFTGPTTGTPVGHAPVNTTPPTIDGSLVEGATVNASLGAWTNAPTSFAYEWFSCNPPSPCTAIKGATKSSYVIADDLLGQQLRVTVTASNASGSASAASAGTAPIQAAVKGSIGSSGTNGYTLGLFYTCRIPGTKDEVSFGCVLVFLLTGAPPGSDTGSPAASAKGKTVVVGSKKVTVKRGKKVKVKIKLNAKGRKLLAKQKKLKVKMTITQKHGKTITKTINFKARPKKHKR